MVGTVTIEDRPKGERSNFILVRKALTRLGTDVSGYTGIVTDGRIDGASTEPPYVDCVQEMDHLRSGDIVAVEPKNGFIRTIFRPDSDNNVIFTTQRCNSNCLMCSQPPQDRDDVEASVRRNLRMIALIPTAPKRLVITGGEPTLLGDHLFSIISAVGNKFPSTHVHMLTNGRSFAWAAFAEKLSALRHPNLSLGIPLYSDDSSSHDFVVQAKGAFDQTVLGLQQLARFGVRVEIRVVLHALTIPRLMNLAEYIYRNCAFAEHIALMGLENIGYAPRNMKALWIDPIDYQGELQSTVEFLTLRGMKVSIYNHQLCVLNRSLWKFARKSISDWKNIYIDKCSGCSVRESCGGFFQWANKLHSAHIHPVHDSH
jgi:His-Xaa-Ser system radical SAM maturase HxsC